MRLLCTLCIGGFKKIQFTLYTYVLAKMSQNCAKFIQKLTPGFKNNMRNLDNFRQAVESSKSWILTGYFCPKSCYLFKKYIPSPKTLYTKDFSNITFNYFCEISAKFLCHFWNHKSFFTTQLLCSFLAQTLHTFCKSSPSRCKFSDFPLLGIKFTRFLMSFIKQKVSFFFKVWIFFSCPSRHLPAQS